MSDRISELLCIIDKLPISELNRQKLRDSLESQREVHDHLIVVDSCVDQAELRRNIAGVLELLEYRRNVMINCASPEQFSEQEYRKLLDRIQSLATKQYVQAQEARRAEQAARPTPIKTLMESSRELRPVFGGRRRVRKP